MKILDYNTYSYKYENEILDDIDDRLKGLDIPNYIQVKLEEIISTILEKLWNIITKIMLLKFKIELMKSLKIIN